MIKSFKDLEVYKESYELSILCCKLSLKLPLYEKNDLGSQIRRCCKSPPANIAEGWAKRRFEKELRKHLDVAIGSCNEMEVHLSTAKDLSYLDKGTCDLLINRYINLGGKLTNLRNNWKTY